MKQINATIISDELADLIRTIDTEDKLLSTTAIIADAYNFIAMQMTEDIKSCADNLTGWTDLLSLLIEYQRIIKILHNEASISPQL